MTGPTTAAELLRLAAAELDALGTPADPPDDNRRVDPYALAAAWPAFQRAGDRLVAAATLHLPEPARTAPGPGHQEHGHQEHGSSAQPPALTGPALSSKPDPHLHRAADLLAAAADLIVMRDRSRLAAEHADADAAALGRQLVRAGHLVFTAAAPDPALLSTTSAAAAATLSWSNDLLTRPPAATGSATLLDASTAPSRPRAAPTDPAGRLEAALMDWRSAALSAAERPAPSRDDLSASARTVGRLLALSQVLLRADPLTTPEAARADPELAATIGRFREAGRRWNTAAQSWQQLATGTRPSAELTAATAALTSAVAGLAHTGADWASSQELRGRVRPEAALAVGRSALAVVQDVAEQHDRAVAGMARRGGLYIAARLLPVPQPGPDQAEKDLGQDLRDEPTHVLAARIAGTLVPAPLARRVHLADTYGALPGSTAAARLSYTALTGAAGAAPDQPAPGQHALARPEPRPPAAPPATVAGQRWQRTVAALDPRLVQDPHYPALAAALDRVELAGVDVTASLAAATGQPLPYEHTARALHFALTQHCPAALTPYTQPAGPPLAPARATPALQPREPARPAPPPPGARR